MRRRDARSRARHAAYMRQWRADNRDRAREISREGSARYVARHPDRFRKSQERYRQRHPETYHGRNRRYRLRHPGRDHAWRALNRHVFHRYGKKRRAAKKTALITLTAAEWQQLKRVHKHRCAYCGKRKPLTQDHIVPLSRGGAHDLCNVIPACRSCNARKSTRTALEYLLFLVILRNPAR